MIPRVIYKVFDYDAKKGKLAALYGKHLLRKTGILSARMRILRIDNYPACERVS